MRRSDTIVIGGGQAGLAMSRCLSERAIDHVVLERGRVAERWRTERWDSLRLLTPSWLSRLPGWRYRGSDPDGYMTMPEVIEYLERYAEASAAPIEDQTTVLSVERSDSGYRVVTDRGDWSARSVVIATGHCDVPHVPKLSAGLSSSVEQLVPSRYRNPDQLQDGGVLIVGASSSGVQLADEIHRSGRPVTLAVGRHIRMPRAHRGKDIMWWLDRMGILGATREEVFDIEASMRQPSLQLVGQPDRQSIDLGILRDRGIRLAGHCLQIERDRVRFSDDLAATTGAADAKLERLLARIDEFAESNALGGERSDPIAPIRTTDAPLELDLRREGIRTVLWATGFRRVYDWLKVPVTDAQGEIVHRGGVTPAEDLYVLGLYFLRTRKSSFIDGVGADAAHLAERIAARLKARRRAA